MLLSFSTGFDDDLVDMQSLEWVVMQDCRFKIHMGPVFRGRVGGTVVPRPYRRLIHSGGKHAGQLELPGAYFEAGVPVSSGEFYERAYDSLVLMLSKAGSGYDAVLGMCRSSLLGLTVGGLSLSDLSGFDFAFSVDAYGQKMFCGDARGVRPFGHIRVDIV